MDRIYNTGAFTNIDFFVGVEVEHTPAFGMQTLFVTGLHRQEVILEKLNEQNSYLDPKFHIRHIFFGANHSYAPITSDNYVDWDNMIEPFLKNDYWCSLDIPIEKSELFLEGSLNEYNTFIPQIRVPLPYIKLWNFNAMIKIDDKGFNKTNPGVWSHSLYNLMDRKNFTHWVSYKNDKII